MTGVPPGRLEGGRRTRGKVRASRPGEPLITVVTVVRNGEAHLEQALESVLGQDYGNVEYIIMDGGSTDGTLDILRRYDDRIDYWTSGPDRGIYDAMNKGIALAKGELVGLLNCDDWYEIGALKAVAREYAKDLTGSAVIAGRWRMIIPGLDDPVEGKPSLKLHTGFPLLHQAMFIPLAVYRKVGPYDTSFRISADFDMVVRMVRNGIRFVFLDTALVHYRTGGASTLRYREAIREGVMVLRKYRVPTGTRFLYRLYMMRLALLTRIANLIEGAQKDSVRRERLILGLKRAYYRLTGSIPPGRRPTGIRKPGN